jgi:LysR family transcriptional regulator, hypochlorite-specific transcription factor HypT
MDIRLFNDLELLRRTGNFTQAAELANTSQPSFSRRIKALETWVGVTLVDRSRQPVKLTSAGFQMLEAGLQAKSVIEKERSQVRAAQSLPEKYVVTFSEQHSISWRFYTNWLQSVEDDFGPILSRLRAGDLPYCMRDLKNGDVDFVIAYSDAGAELEEETSIVIGKDRLLPVCKPDDDGQPAIAFKDGDAFVPYLQFGEDSPISRHLEPVFEDHNLYARLTSIYENSIAGALLIRLREGEGVAWLPESLIEADLVNGSLVRTGEKAWQVPLDIRLHRNPKYSNALTRSIWSFLQEQQKLKPQN